MCCSSRYTLPVRSPFRLLVLTSLCLLLGFGTLWAAEDKSGTKTHFDPPAFLAAPDAARTVTNRAVTMVSSLAVSENGRLWATWYAGELPGENHANYVVLATSGDAGQTWEEVLVADPDGMGPVRSYDPEVWIAPNGHLYWFWAQGERRFEHDVAPLRWETETWALEIKNPKDARPQYEQPFRIAEGVMMCKPIALDNGEWALPVSHWKSLKNSAQMVVSTDQGKTWVLRGAADVPADVRSFDEHIIVPRLDGSLWMLVRTRYGIGESSSRDGGKTWSALTPSAIPHSNTRFFIRRLASGKLLLVRHADNPEAKKIVRSHLTAYISKDDGQTWSRGWLIDERSSISYPDADQAADGTIYLTYDHGRVAEREILLVAFTEDEVLSADGSREVAKPRQLVISKGSGGKEKVAKKK